MTAVLRRHRDDDTLFQLVRYMLLQMEYSSSTARCQPIEVAKHGAKGNGAVSLDTSCKHTYRGCGTCRVCRALPVSRIVHRLLFDFMPAFSANKSISFVSVAENRPPQPCLR